MQIIRLESETQWSQKFKQTRRVIELREKTIANKTSFIAHRWIPLGHSRQSYERNYLSDAKIICCSSSFSACASLHSQRVLEAEDIFTAYTTILE